MSSRMSEEWVKGLNPLDVLTHGDTLILLPLDVQGRGNALIISSRMPLKEKPSDGFGGAGRAAGWGAAEGGRLRWGKRHSTASGSDRDGTGCVCLTPLN